MLSLDLYLLSKKSHNAFFEILHYLKKKKIYQIDQKIIKLTNLTKNGILSNFDLLGRQSNIFGVAAVAYTRICTVLQGNLKKTVHICEFAPAVTQNISD